MSVKSWKVVLFNHEFISTGDDKDQPRWHHGAVQSVAIRCQTIDTNPVCKDTITGNSSRLTLSVFHKKNLCQHVSIYISNWIALQYFMDIKSTPRNYRTYRAIE